MPLVYWLPTTTENPPEHAAILHYAQQEYNNSIVLLWYDFIYGDFIWSIAMIYTYQSHDIDAIWDIIDLEAHTPLAPGLPIVDFK